MQLQTDGHLTLARASAELAAAFVEMRDAFTALGEDEWRGGAIAFPEIRVIEKCGGRRIADSTRRRYLIST